MVVSFSSGTVQRPVVCLDETNRQLIEKRSIPPKPGNPERENYEYRRCSVADLFVAFEPLACKRVVKLTDTRTAVDFAHFLRELIEVHYSHCEKSYWSWIIWISTPSLRCIRSLIQPQPDTSHGVWRSTIHPFTLHGWIWLKSKSAFFPDSACLNPCPLLNLWLVRSTHRLYTEMPLVLLSIGDFLLWCQM